MKTDLGTLVCEIAEGLEGIAEEQRSRSMESMVRVVRLLKGSGQRS